MTDKVVTESGKLEDCSLVGKQIGQADMAVQACAIHFLQMSHSVHKNAASLTTNHRDMHSAEVNIEKLTFCLISLWLSLCMPLSRCVWFHA